MLFNLLHLYTISARVELLTKLLKVAELKCLANVSNFAKAPQVYKFILLRKGQNKIWCQFSLLGQEPTFISKKVECLLTFHT